MEFEFMREAVDLISYIKYGAQHDPVFYKDKIASKRRQLKYTYVALKKACPDFAGLNIIMQFMDK